MSSTTTGKYVLRTRMWRELCFARVMFRHFRVRLVLMGLILLGGACMFLIFEPERNHSFPRAIFYTWSLVFGEAPEEFPESGVLRIMFFVVPVLGLTVIIEGIIDLALMIRDRRRSERSWCIMLASSYKNHVVIVGFGKLGYRTYLLLRKMGEPVVVIERNEQGQFLDDLREEGSPLLIGDARRDTLLEGANVANARSIVLATDDDMTNLEAALDARRINPKIRVVLRVFDQTVADKIGEGFDFDVAMSQAGLSAPSFATAAVQPEIVGSYELTDRMVVMQRWLVRQGGPLVDRTVREVNDTLGVAVIEHRRAGEEPTLFPRSDAMLEAGDGVIVQGSFDTIGSLKRQVMAVPEWSEGKARGR